MFNKPLTTLITHTLLSRTRFHCAASSRDKKQRKPEQKQESHEKAARNSIGESRGAVSSRGDREGVCPRQNAEVPSISLLGKGLALSCLNVMADGDSSYSPQVWGAHYTLTTWNADRKAEAQTAN